MLALSYQNKHTQKVTLKTHILDPCGMATDGGDGGNTKTLAGAAWAVMARKLSPSWHCAIPHVICTEVAVH